MRVTASNMLSWHSIKHSVDVMSFPALGGAHIKRCENRETGVSRHASPHWPGPPPTHEGDVPPGPSQGKLARPPEDSTAFACYRCAATH